MGNCVRKGSSVAATRDIKCPMPMPVPETQFEDQEKNEGEKIGRVIKIKITKKQLEELLGKVEVQGNLPVELLLAELRKGQVVQDDDDSDDHQRSWRPTLESIPEYI